DFSRIFEGFDFRKALRFWDKFLIAEPDPALRRYKAFFRSLDLETNPELQTEQRPDRERVERLKEALHVLIDQMRIRLEGIAGGQSRPLSDFAPETSPALVQHISDLMLPVYRDFFSDSTPRRALDQDQIAQAFCRHANGELRTGEARIDNEGLWNCEPDS